MKKLFYFLFIKIIISNYKIEKVFEWNSNSNETFNLKSSNSNNSIFSYFPSQIRIDKNDKIYVSFPNDYFGKILNPPFKFAILENNKFKQFLDFEDDKNCTNESKLCNCVSFEIDENDNFYFLDQINNTNAKIIIYNNKEKKIKNNISLNFKNENEHFYLNFVVDTKNEIIYLIHSFYSYYNLNLFVIENIYDEHYKFHKIKDNFFWTKIKPFNNYFEIKNLGLSCDYKHLFISSLLFNIIYSIKIEDIFKCIEKDEQIIEEIVEENNIQNPTNSFIFSSKGNLYFGGKYSYDIFISYNIKNKITEINSDNLKRISVENDEIQIKNNNENEYKIINSMFIHNKYLFFLENNFGIFIDQNKKTNENKNLTNENKVSYYGIYKIDLKKDNSINEGCQYLKFKNDKIVIIFWTISFIFIIFIMIILFIGSRKKNEIANSYLKLSNSRNVSMINMNDKRTTN